MAGGLAVPVFLVACARALTDEDIATEYDNLFGGVGTPALYLFGSHYRSGFLNEKPLVALRKDLAALGLQAFDGELEMDGRRWGAGSSADKAIRASVQVVFQDPFSSLSPRMTVSKVGGCFPMNIPSVSTPSIGDGPAGLAVRMMSF